MTAREQARLIRLAQRGVAHLVLAVGSVVFCLPFAWLVATSFKGEREIFLVPMRWIPEAFTARPLIWHTVFQNFITADEFVPVWVWIRNTLQVSVLEVTFTVLSSSFVAYGFSRIRWRGRDTVFMLVLATLMLPAQVTMIPTFLIFNYLGWYNTLQPLWVGSLFGGAFNIFLLRQFMMTLPVDLDDAARIDGCGHFRIYRMITLPLVKPALAVVAVQTFQGAWNNFLGPYIYINTKDKMTIALGLQWFKSEHLSMYGEMMATSLVMTLPMIVIFFLCQRYMIQGISLTGIKG
ncbi:MAG: carbohydrate ABC transporter permease [Candidatus Hydrogenedentes bacterium]|nr:carbohydrate ABC transporter permease [Candidatus Hydrogenedentota bacterium]